MIYKTGNCQYTIKTEDYSVVRRIQIDLIKIEEEFETNHYSIMDLTSSIQKRE